MLLYCWLSPALAAEVVVIVTITTGVITIAVTVNRSVGVVVTAELAMQAEVVGACLTLERFILVHPSPTLLPLQIML